ncbi:MAG TPA: flagellar export protein FliJ [Clostridium sp.]|uniref:Flagellar FliJ protein n=2 Tax=Acetivibrio mesophilus TaxID=2487273 RepID=A0A4Q0I783_9FIRM|nr:flagellar export protein FliJ [Acetivibrio mesophilus]HHV29868.1 flagellar export protein FliJ [Clostridium sp.]
MIIMGKFVFRMQTLLNLKIQLENGLKNELGRAVQELERQKDILNGLIKERDEYIDSINSKSEEGISVGKLREYNMYISYLNERAKLQKDNIKKAQLVVDNYRDKLIKAMQEKKVLEKLKEKKYEEYMKEQLKEEQKLNDEIVSFNLSHSAE